MRRGRRCAAATRVGAVATTTFYPSSASPKRIPSSSPPPTTGKPPAGSGGRRRGFPSASAGKSRALGPLGGDGSGCPSGSEVDQDQGQECGRGQRGAGRV